MTGFVAMILEEQTSEGADPAVRRRTSMQVASDFKKQTSEGASPFINEPACLAGCIGLQEADFGGSHLPPGSGFSAKRCNDS